MMIFIPAWPNFMPNRPKARPPEIQIKTMAAKVKKNRRNEFLVPAPVFLH
jgi:hypothetical protein